MRDLGRFAAEADVHIKRRILIVSVVLLAFVMTMFVTASNPVVAATKRPYHVWCKASPPGGYSSDWVQYSYRTLDGKNSALGRVRWCLKAGETVQIFKTN